MDPQILLPPGSDGWTHFLSNCNQCYDCISICPQEALRVVRDSGSIQEGYPAIFPALAICQDCSDQPCIAACPTEALSADPDRKPRQELYIDENTCLAFSGQFCMTCVSQCPLGGTALALDEDGKPKLNSEICTACGICIQVCPAPQTAIHIKHQEVTCQSPA